MAHATLDKAQVEERDLNQFEDKIAFLENQVDYYKSS
jgi:hypothetical protein